MTLRGFVTMAVLGSLGDGFLVSYPPMMRTVRHAAAATEGENSQWMSDYLVRVHEARLGTSLESVDNLTADAVARAREEARQEALERIADLEAQLAALRGQPIVVPTESVETVEPDPVVVVEPEPVVEPPAVVETNRHYEIRKQDMEKLASRWGPEEIDRLTLGDAYLGDASIPPSKSTYDRAYEQRLENKAGLSSRWGDEELQRIEREKAS